MPRHRSTPLMKLETGEGFLAGEPRPGLLLAHTQAKAAATFPDRLAIPATGITLGRNTSAEWCVPDKRLSNHHTRFWLQSGEVMVQDMASTNGTYCAGQRLDEAAHAASPGDVIRCGRLLLVVCPDLNDLSVGFTNAQQFGLIGRFHAPTILAQLVEAAAVGGHILLSGDSGTGKELAAKALASLLADRGQGSGNLLAHNCATFANEEEATTTLFGVSSGVFSGVSARPGLLEQATAGSLLFLDEVHALPERVQQSLLRFVEDGIFSRIGDPKHRKIKLTLLLGTNRNIEHAMQQRLLAFDLVNRLQHVHLPALRHRRADIPDLFLHYLQLAATNHQHDLDPTEMVKTVRPAHLEAICLNDYQAGNVREIIGLANSLAARAASRNQDPQSALGHLLSHHYPENPVVQRALQSTANKSTSNTHSSPSPTPRRSPAKGHSSYERNRSTIIAAYRSTHGNLSKTVRLLKTQGLPGSRRWLAKYLKEWGER